MRGVGVAIVWSLLSAGAASGQALIPSQSVPTACPAIVDWIESGAGFEFIVNPIAATVDEVGSLYAEFERIQDCLDSTGLDTDRLRRSAPYLDLFLAFMAPAVSPTTSDPVELIDLLETRDPGIRQLREDFGLRAPEGRVFVREFVRVDEMPAVVGDAFVESETRAVTIGTRYIAVLTGGAPRGPALETTLSHELVHAFLNARLGARLFDDGFPGWFHEGMAIRFSGSGRAHAAFDPVGRNVMIFPTSEYERYERVFAFLEQRLGDDGFRRGVRDSVESADADILLTRAGFDSYDDAARSADLWWRWWPVPSRWLVAPTLWIFLAVLVAGVAISWKALGRWQPAVPGSALEVGVNEQLFEAIKSADDVGVRFALRSGAEPRVTDREGWTPLRWAVFLNRTRPVEWLLAAGAEPTRELLVFADLRDTDPDIIRMLADALPPERPY